MAALVALGAGSGEAARQAGGVVRADGRIGPFRIDRTSEAQIRAVAGRPVRVEAVFNDVTRARVGRTLFYRCGRGCLTAYSIARSTRRLSDFWTRSPRFRTQRGSRAGMTVAQAERLEAKRFGPGCGDGLYLHVRFDRSHIFVLTGDHGRVDGITYLGPHSVYYEGLC
jgi:hypothetical protein